MPCVPVMLAVQMMPRMMMVMRVPVYAVQLPTMMLQLVQMMLDMMVSVTPHTMHMPTMVCMMRAPVC